MEVISGQCGFDSRRGFFFGGWMVPKATTQSNHPSWGGCGGGDPDVFCVEIDSALAPQLVCARFLTELDFNRL